jgi:hypothetical protein
VGVLGSLLVEDNVVMTGGSRLDFRDDLIGSPDFFLKSLAEVGRMEEVVVGGAGGCDSIRVSTCDSDTCRVGMVSKLSRAFGALLNNACLGLMRATGDVSLSDCPSGPKDGHTARPPCFDFNFDLVAGRGNVKGSSEIRGGERCPRTRLERIMTVDWLEDELESDSGTVIGEDSQVAGGGVLVGG